MPDIRVTAATPPHEAASHGRRLAGWIPSSTGPVKSVEVGLQTLRNRSRDAVRNDGLAASGCRNWTAALVGSGIVARTKTDDPALKRAIDRQWAAWLPVCDADGVLDFYGLQSLVGRSLFESGEAFVRIRPRRPEDRLPAPVQLQVLESDMLPMLDSQNGDNRIIQGIELNKLGQRVAYWFHGTHPGDGMGSSGE